jgi:hypothetical protein
MVEEAATLPALNINWYIPILIVVILLAGSLGGWVNYYLTRVKDQDHASLRESLVIGIAAAFLVPLFLQMISSTLLTSGASNPLELFVFAGFCLVASISSRSFVQTLSERVLKEAREDAQNAKAVAQEAKAEVDKVKGATDSVQKQMALATASVMPLSEAADVSLRAASPQESLETLVEKYNELRKTPSSKVRSDNMTAVLRQMINIVPFLDDFPIRQYLGETDNRGRRLAAYAYLYTKPDFNLLPELVDSVTKIEDKPFGQYWGILTIGKAIGERSRNEVPREVLKALRRFHDSLAPGTDRYYELSRLLDDIEKSPGREA